MKDDHDFVTKSRRDTAAIQFPLYLPDEAEQIVSIKNGSGPVRRIEFDGGTGTSSTRQIKVDVGLGTFGSSILTYDESKRYIVTVYIRSTGWSIVLHDVTTSGHSTQLWSSAQLGFGTAPDTSIKVSHTITMGASGTPEFGEVVQCPPDWSGVDSWGASGVQTIDGDSPGASMELMDDIQFNYGDYYVKFGQAQTGGVRNERVFGSSGRSFKDLPTVFGDYDTLFPRMKGSRFRVYSTTPNPLTDNHDPAVFVPLARTFILACANAGVDLDWIFQPPVDDSSASDQDNLRATNDQIAAILQEVASDITVRIVRLDNEYSDAEAAALSSDNVHPDDYAPLGALIESLGFTHPQTLFLSPSSPKQSQTRTVMAPLPAIAQKLQEMGLVPTSPPIQSSSFRTARQDPYLYFLKYRLGLVPALSYSEALSRGGWFAECWRYQDDPEYVQKLASQLSLRVSELGQTAKQFALGEHARQAIVDRERRDAACAVGWFEACLDLKIPGREHTVRSFFKQERWDLMGTEVLIRWTDPLFEHPMVGRLDSLYYDNRTNRVWVRDDKTTSYNPEHRAQAVVTEYQPELYLFMMKNLMAAGLVQEEFGIPADAELGGMIHMAFQKPTINFGTKDRGYDLVSDGKKKKRQGKWSGGRILIVDTESGETLMDAPVSEEQEAFDTLWAECGKKPEKRYEGEPSVDRFVDRCKDWYRAEGEYEKERETRERTPPVAFSFLSMDWFESRWTQFCHRTKFLVDLATRKPDPTLFMQGSSIMDDHGRLSPYAPLYVNPVRAWAPLILENQLAVVHRYQELHGDNLTSRHGVTMAKKTTTKKTTKKPAPKPPVDTIFKVFRDEIIDQILLPKLRDLNSDLMPESLEELFTEFRKVYGIGAPDQEMLSWFGDDLPSTRVCFPGEIPIDPHAMKGATALVLDPQVELDELRRVERKVNESPTSGSPPPDPRVAGPSRRLTGSLSSTETGRSPATPPSILKACPK